MRCASSRARRRGRHELWMGAKTAYSRGRGRGVYKPADATSRAHRLRMRRKRHLKTMPSCEGCIRGNRPVCLPSSSSGRSVAETLPLSQERPPHRSPAHHRALTLGSCGHAVARACVRPCDRRVFCLSSLVRSQLSCTAPTETPRWHGASADGPARGEAYSPAGGEGRISSSI